MNLCSVDLGVEFLAKLENFHPGLLQSFLKTCRRALAVSAEFNPCARNIIIEAEFVTFVLILSRVVLVVLPCQLPYLS